MTPRHTGQDEVQRLCLQLIDGQVGPDAAATQKALLAFCALVKKWNPFASLVSSQDAERLWLHIADSLSLLETIHRLGGSLPRLFDIGSGAGFPAIPLALAMPGLQVTMVERSRKKAGFLENALGELALLPRATILQGTFPQEIALEKPGGWLVTARAVEDPGNLWPGVRALVQEGATFLCQWPDLPLGADKMFHVEQLIDDWTQSGLRRGSLHIIQNR